MPIEAPRRSARTRKLRPALASRSNDFGCGNRPAVKARISGHRRPSSISANISSQRARSASRRATFSIEPAVATTVSPPRSRFARSARRVAIAWYCPPELPTGSMRRNSRSPARRRSVPASPARAAKCQQQQDPQQSLSAPPAGGTLCRLIARHRLSLAADDESGDGSKRERADERGARALLHVSLASSAPSCALRTVACPRVPMPARQAQPRAVRAAAAAARQASAAVRRQPQETGSARAEADRRR